MKLETDKYTFDELKLFYGLVDETVREARSRECKISVHDMLKRLFACAADGERAPEKLKTAMLKQETEVLSDGPTPHRYRPLFSSLPVPDAYLIRMVGRPVKIPLSRAPSSPEMPLPPAAL